MVNGYLVNMVILYWVFGVIVTNDDVLIDTNDDVLIDEVFALVIVILPTSLLSLLYKIKVYNWLLFGDATGSVYGGVYIIVAAVSVILV